MKDIKEYIFEKSSDNPNVNLSINYSVGDKCLYLRHSGLRSQEKVTIELVKLTKVTKTILGFEFLTHFSTRQKNDQIKFKPSQLQRYDYMFTSGMSSTTMIISNESVNDILKLIEENNNKLDLYSLLHGENQRQDYLVPVKKLIDIDTFNPKFDDYENISKEILNEIKDLLK